MNHRFVGILSIIATILGILCYGYFNEWLIIRNPWINPYHAQTQVTRSQKKEILLFVWRHDCWQKDMVSLKLPENIQEQALIIVQAWLHEAFQSGFIHTACTLEAALLDTRTGCLYLSFATSPCDIHASTYTTLVIIESLLKTIRYNMPDALQSIQLMVHHTPLEHPHIECTRPLALTGFGITHD